MCLPQVQFTLENDSGIRLGMNGQFSYHVREKEVAVVFCGRIHAVVAK